MRERIHIPYHRQKKGLSNQILDSSRRRQSNPIAFIFKKTRNHILQILALYCPIKSWRVMFHRWRGVHIGNNVFIGYNCMLDHAYPEYVYLEDNCGLTGDVYILAHTNPKAFFADVFESYVAPVVIGKNAWIGVRSTILPGARIGENSVVSAGTIVSKNVPDNTLVAAPKNRSIKLKALHR
ncbi:MAG: acyltransferase [Tissierellia bacterium]|nr:acyltransferase [Tissierellia bacterium]